MRFGLGAGLGMGLIACAVVACGGDDATGTSVVDAGNGGGGDASTGGDGGSSTSDGGAGVDDAGGAPFDGGSGPASIRVVNITPPSAAQPITADVWIGDLRVADDFGSGRGNDAFVSVASGTVSVDVYADGGAPGSTPSASTRADLVAGRAYVAVVVPVDGAAGVFVFDASAPIVGATDTSVQFVNASDYALLDLSIIHTADDLEGWALDVATQTASPSVVRLAGDYQLALEYADGAPTPDARYLLNAPGGFDLRLYASSAGGAPTLWYEAVPGQLVPMTPL